MSPDTNLANKERSWKQSLLLGLGLAFAHLVLILIVIGWHYPNLIQWDGNWYNCIVANGYRSTLPPVVNSCESNVGFFPGYPLLAMTFVKIFKIKSTAALLLTAQAMEAMLFVLLFRFGLSLAAMALLATFPGAMFLLAAYSESTFLAALALLLLGCRDLRSKSGFAMAALGAFYLTFTRPIGAVALCLPAFAWFSSKPRTTLRSSAVIGLGICGITSFLIWCQLKIGAWDVYFQTLHANWSDSGITTPRWQIFFTNLNLSAKKPSDLGRLFSFVTLIGGAILSFKAYRQKWASPFSLAAALSGLTMLLTTLVVRFNARGADGMVRYLLPCLLLMLPLLDEYMQQKKSSPQALVYYIAWLIFAVAIQASFILTFGAGEWVA